MAAQVEARMIRRGMTQLSFARLAGVQRQYVSAVFRGRRRKTDLDEWAALLGARFVIELVDIDDDRPDDDLSAAIADALFMLHRCTREPVRSAEIIDVIAQLDAADRRRRDMKQ